MMKYISWIIIIDVVHYSMEYHENINGVKLMNTHLLRERAFNTMSYHRSMMNEYLCRNYLANEIVENLRKQFINKKFGTPADKVTLMLNRMLEDPGSRKYNDWLSRSTTLEDIYRHYESISDGELQRSQTAPVGDGEVTGYALLGDKVAGHGLGDFSSGYGYHHYEHLEEGDEHEDKSVKLKEIFDLALTAIAFLAFGTFITETMIHGFGMQNQEAQMMIVSPMPGVNGISFKSNVEDLPLLNTEKRSLKGESFQWKKLNEISRWVLTSIEALILADRDGGKCLRRSLCEINKYSRDLHGTQKIWLSLWSFGASWMAGKFIKSDTHSLLENFKASLLGFSNEECANFFKMCDAMPIKRKILPQRS